MARGGDAPPTGDVVLRRVGGAKRDALGEVLLHQRLSAQGVASGDGAVHRCGVHAWDVTAVQCMGQCLRHGTAQSGDDYVGRARQVLSRDRALM